MKRLIATLLVVSLAVVLMGMAALAWVAGTTNGARWLLGSLSRHGGLQISAHKVEGRLAGRLRLEGVRIALPHRRLELDSLELRWKPLLLLAGTVGIRELALNGVRIDDSTPPGAPPGTKPPKFDWPRVSDRALLMDVAIAHLRVNDLSYRHIDGQSLDIGRVAASVDWQNSLLSARGLEIIAPTGRITGAITAGLRHPSLKTDLEITTPHPLAGMQRLSLMTRLVPGQDPELMAGQIAIRVAGKKSGQEQRLELAGLIGMTRAGFNLRDLQLTRPGRTGRINAKGTLIVAAKEPLLTLQVQVADLNLEPDINLPTNLSGQLSLSGSLKNYHGHFDLGNQGTGWRTASISADYHGTRQGLKLAPLKVALLDGTVQGNLDIGWRDRIELSGTLAGRHLNPARIAPDWKGVANFDLTAAVSRSGDNPPQGKVDATLLESRLHGHPLTGELRAAFSGDNLVISRLALQGKGFNLQGAGELGSRLNLTAQVSDLSRLLPGTAGELQARGWVRRRDGRLGGAFSGHGLRLAKNGIRIAAADLNGRIGDDPDHPLHLAAKLRGLEYGRMATDAATLEADGTISDHTVRVTLRSTNSEAHIALSGGYSQDTWQGAIKRLSGRDSFGPWSLAAPAALKVTTGKITLAPLVLSGAAAERIEIVADLSRQPLRGTLAAEWNRLNLARANAWLQDMQINGSSTGSLQAALPTENQLTFSGKATALGTVTTGGRSFVVRRGEMTLDGGQQGVRSAIEVHLADGSMLQGRLASTTPARPALPEDGTFSMEWKLPDLSLLRAFLPAVNLRGGLTGRTEGRFLPGRRIEMEGRAALSQAGIKMKREAGELDFNLRTASLSWNWRGNTLTGDIDLALAEHGQARGNFQLPLPAKLPVAINRQGEIRGSITGKVQEKGLLTAIFPGMVQESHGELTVDLRAGGSWDEPKFEGLLQLAGAGAYLPASGIRVRDVKLTAHLEKDLIRIDTFRAVSGPGHIEGDLLLRLKGWHPISYSGRIKGENFQTINFPEIEVQSTPQLSFEGTPKKLVVQGEVRLPVMRITAPPYHAPIGPSKDVIVEGRQPPPPKSSPLAVEAQVRLVLGDRVLVKMSGIDAQLGGSMDLTMKNLDEITSKGEIRVTKGRYQTYGVTLDIVRGRLFYAGGPIDQPTLDILALRTTGEVRAGVTISGSIQAPVTKLYSEPSMPDVDILAYIVLGHPLGGGSGEQIGLMTQAAGALLSAGQSASLQDQIKSRLGLSTLEIQTAPGATSGRMGYKPITSTPPGAASSSQPSGISQTMVTVGKFLTPQIYVSYGRSLFTNSNLFLLRYDISRRWQIETQTGQESGLDVYYKIEFN